MSDRLDRSQWRPYLAAAGSVFLVAAAPGIGSPGQTLVALGRGLARSGG